jgi:hypothetical protein
LCPGVSPAAAAAAAAAAAGLRRGERLTGLFFGGRGGWLPGLWR